LIQEKKKCDESGDFERAEIVKLEVGEAAIMKILRPSSQTLPAKIV
jgi:hypothetical protein